ncbi:MAG: signal peptidase I [bacterium]
MTGFFEKRRMLKRGREWLHHALVTRHMREDRAPAGALKQLDEARAGLKAVLEARHVERIEKQCEIVQQAIAMIVPPRPYAGFRENLEVLIVAVAVAMAFRCYFLQPFKIPTGSMQPSLYGIHYSAQSEKGLMDQWPLRAVKWLVWGEWYGEVTAKTAGTFRGPYKMQRTGDGTAIAYYDIGGLEHALPDGMPLTVKHGDEVVTGQVIACGNTINGDHLFVNRVKWNFMKPSRGEVMVFRTDGIPIPRLTERTHYIKRMCGLPGDTLTIRPPELIVNGQAVQEPRSIRQIEDRVPGYSGYTLGEGPDALFINSVRDTIHLGTGQYLALGDNTRNSLDGRYWGPVPVENLVGPAMIVYWPFSKRWGWVR